MVMSLLARSMRVTTNGTPVSESGTDLIFLHVDPLGTLMNDNFANKTVFSSSEINNWEIRILRYV